MPTRQQHLAKAAENELFFESIDLARGQFLGWAVIGLFYSALHYVDAHLATRNIHPLTHRDRTFRVARDPQLRPLYGAYKELENRSEDARYRYVEFTPELVRRLYEVEFARIRNAVV